LTSYKNIYTLDKDLNMAKKNKRVKNQADNSRLPMLLSLLFVVSIVGVGVIVGSMSRDYAVLGAKAKQAKDKTNGNGNNTKQQNAVPVRFVMTVGFSGEPVMTPEPTGKAMKKKVQNNRRVTLEIFDQENKLVKKSNANLKVDRGFKVYQGDKVIGGLRTGDYTVVVSAKNFSSYSYSFKLGDVERKQKNVKLPAFTLTYTGVDSPTPAPTVVE
jgi:hypothetical protein